MSEPEPEPEPDSAAGPATTQAVERKYEVQSVNLVCTWRFGAGFSDTCGICKTSLYEASLDCQAHNIEDVKHDGWSIATGECTHAYHYDCIKKFIERGRPNCPVCSAAWRETSVVPISSMLGGD